MAQTSDRGRTADSPQEIPARGWRDILLRVKREIAEDHIGVLSAGVAFYALLAIFPAIAALMSLAALAFDPADIEAELSALARALPADAASIIEDQGRRVAAQAGAGVSVAALGGLLLAIFSASKGMKTLIEGLNVAYEENEKRGFVRLTATALVLTGLLILGLLCALGATIAAPAVLDALRLPPLVETAIAVGRWLLLAALTVVGLGVIYRFAPSREQAQWRWVTPGSIAATAIWILGSIAFSIYAGNFGSYNSTYGAIGGVIMLLTWLWLSAYIVLLGGELNAEMEHQTRRDTTTGQPRPEGERGAQMADTVGPTP